MQIALPPFVLLAGTALLGACGAPGAAVRAPSPAAVGETPEPEYTWPALSLSVGGQLFAEVDTKMRVDSPTLGLGTEIDLEDDFDVDDQVFAGRLDASWRFARRHGLEFSLFDLKRSGTRTIDREIQIGDEVFPINTAVESDFQTTVAKLAYRYAFLRRERWQAGASLGTYWLDMSAEWKAGVVGLEEEFSVGAPLPVLGLFGSYALSRKLYLSASTEFFGLEYEEYEGFLNDTRVLLEHRTFEHLAFGLGLDYFGINASVDSDGAGQLQAEFDYDYLGLMLFARLY